MGSEWFHLLRDVLARGGGGGGGWCMPLGNLKLTPMDKRQFIFSLTLQLDRTLQYYFRSMAIYTGGGGGGGGGRGGGGGNAT